MDPRPGLSVVTAASSNHAGPLGHMLASLKRLDADVDCVDLGLTTAERDRLPRWRGLTIRSFEYAAHPPHMDVTVNAGEYAWKPVIVADAAARERASARPRHVLWADAGSYFEALEPIERAIDASDGVWLRRSSGTVADWTHPGMFAFLNEDGSRFAALPNADATLVGLGTGHRHASIREAVHRDIVEPWKACAMTRDCIAPAGSSRRNHRQDQAVLTYLVHKAGHAFASATHDDLKIRCKCDRWFYRYIGFNVPASFYSRCCLY